ncbi:MAG: class I SAM-dependent methyltransferase [Gammaproteobacteria bacterium]
MRADADRWNRKYAKGAAYRPFSPDPLLERMRERLRLHSRSVGGGRLLELACGRADNAILGAMCGYRATGVDISETGLRLARGNAARFGLALEWLTADLDDYTLPIAHYDVVLVFRYLNRELFAGLAEALRPGGLLVYKTFNRAHLDRHPGFPEDFVLQPGELRGQFEGLQLVATNEPAGGLPESDTSSYLVAARPAVESPAPGLSWRTIEHREKRRP